ncbi:MAG: SH3 domain-containing protein [Chloroflexi bacterium]|nr:SH3 domain-containing protein [Chloroflexota bacterium]
MDEKQVPEPAGPPSLEQSLGGAGGPEPPVWLALLHNRLILAGLSVIVLLLLIVVVLFTIGGGDDGSDVSFALGTTTPDGEPTAVPGNGVVGRVLTTATVFNGPSNSFDIRGTVPSGATVSVSGRNDDGSWLQIVYPPNSSLRGWVEVDLVEVTDDIMLLAIAEAGAPPAIDIPTSAAPAATSIPVVTATPVASDTPVPATETPTQPPPTVVATPPPTITPPPSETAEETLE